MMQIELFQNWMCDNVEPCNWSNDKRYKNYLAKVEMDAEGEEKCEYLPSSKQSDLYFNVSSLNTNDIVVASCWDAYKHRQRKHYYIVIEKNADGIILDGGKDDSYTTYRKAYKGIKL